MGYSTNLFHHDTETQRKAGVDPVIWVMEILVLMHPSLKLTEKDLEMVRDNVRNEIANNLDVLRLEYKGREEIFNLAAKSLMVEIENETAENVARVMAAAGIVGVVPMKPKVGFRVEKGKRHKKGDKPDEARDVSNT